jgi:1-acyl-sn-glycerol-3-phosphate acyltransferase
VTRENQQYFAAPAPYRGAGAELWRWLCTLYLKAGGWRMEGDWPAHLPKMVLVAAPHTSNWDGVNMLAAAGYYRVPLKWMGKKELTQGPLGGLVKWLGCVPVDRSGKGDLVAETAAHMRAAKTMVLAVAPEGTRAKSKGWKTGFYYIALAAGVPIVMSVLDYGAKKISIAGSVTPSGNYEADIAAIKAAYAGARGKYNDRVAQ